ncbi:MAG TPA: hypothetical protein VMG12_06875, partial [Polyangiaceae bacterium]|nr:hypothetical protein [Polyangiaceae bacterium]
CVPGSRRCNPQTGVPQLCGGSGAYQNQTPCRTGEVCTASGNTTSCTCQNNLTACQSGCFDLNTDASNCGSCGHSCQGSTCSAGRCNPTTIASGQVVASRMALNTNELFFATTGGDLYRITKEGAGLRAIVISSNVRGLAADGTTVYWTLDETPGQIWRVTQSGNGTLTNYANSPDGLGGYAYRYLVDIASGGGSIKTDAVYVSGGSVYWVDGGYRRASTTASIPASGELLGEAISSFSTTSLMAPAGTCVYGVDSSLMGIVRACTGGGQASVYSGNLIMDIVADSSAVYFSEHSIGIKRMALNSTTPTITNLAPTSAVPLSLTTDQNFVYYIDGGATADLCSPNMTIKRVAKSGGTPTTLVQLGSNACPKVVSVDDTFLYYATWDDPGTGGAISRVAK